MPQRNFECHTSKCKHVLQKRTPSQNNALHLYFEMVAEALNGAGLPVKHVLTSYKVDLDWDKDSVKDLIWRPIQKALLGKASTTELRKQEDIDRVYDHINRFLSNEPFNLHVPFPVDEERQAEKTYRGKKYEKEYPDGPTETAFDE